MPFAMPPLPHYEEECLPPRHHATIFVGFSLLLRFAACRLPALPARRLNRDRRHIMPLPPPPLPRHYAAACHADIARVESFLRDARACRARYALLLPEWRRSRHGDEFCSERRSYAAAQTARAFRDREEMNREYLQA